MPIVSLEPGHSIPLSKCVDCNPMEETTITNNSDAEGRYVISYDLAPLSVQYRIAPGHHSTMCSSLEGTIENNGDVTLAVQTPGL
ncbi:MAG: hypothetical protein AAF431_18820 [Pseudomonadota bacterium]